MLYVKTENGKAISATNEYPGNESVTQYQTRHDWKTFIRAEEIAAELTAASNERFIAIDNGPHCWPRFDVVALPKVGDEVSYTFNGDYYPDGKIVAISKSLRVIRTDSGRTYYRRRLTGAWINNGIWSLVPGHRHEYNPSF